MRRRGSATACCSSTPAPAWTWHAAGQLAQSIGALGKAGDEFARIDRLNAMLRRFNRVDRRKYSVQLANLRPEDPVVDPGDADSHRHLEFLRSLQAGADTAAQHFQRLLLGDFLPRRTTWLRLGKGVEVVWKERRLPSIGTLALFTTLLVATVGCFEAHDHLGHDWRVLLAYLLLPSLGVAGYQLVVKRRGWQNRFQDYRALAEAMRVQIAWACAALPRAASDHYLRLQRDELGWIQFALRGPALWAAGLALELRNPLRPLVNECWIDDQCAFFLGPGGKAEANRKTLHRSKLCAETFGWASLGLSLLLGYLRLAEFVGARTGWFTIAEPWLEQAQGWLLVAIAVSGAAFSAFLLSAERWAYEAHANAYLALGRIFDKARREARSNACARDDAEYRNLVFDLGREALAENAAWLQDHRRRPIEHHAHGG